MNTTIRFLSLAAALSLSTACLSEQDSCDPASLENLYSGQCGAWNDSNVPTFSAQGNLAMFMLCRETAAATMVREPAMGGAQHIVYCSKDDTADSYPLAWGKGHRPGVFLVSSDAELADVVMSYWDAI